MNLWIYEPNKSVLIRLVQVHVCMYIHAQRCPCSNLTRFVSLPGEGTEIQRDLWNLETLECRSLRVPQSPSKSLERNWAFADWRKTRNEKKRSQRSPSSRSGKKRGNDSAPWKRDFSRLTLRLTDIAKSRTKRPDGGSDLLRLARIIARIRLGSTLA